MIMYFVFMLVLLVDIFLVVMCGIGMLLVYNIVVIIFGGFVGFIIIWLIDFIGNKLLVSYFVIFGVVLSLIVMLVVCFVLCLC